MLPGLASIIVGNVNPTIPDFVSGSAFVNSSTTSVTVDAPIGVQEGDHLICAIFRTAVSAPTYPGWTLVGTFSNSAGRIDIVQKIASDAEPSTYTFTSPNTGRFCANIIAYRGGKGLVSGTPSFDMRSGDFTNSVTIDPPVAGRLVYFACIMGPDIPLVQAPNNMASIYQLSFTNTMRAFHRPSVNWAGPTGSKVVVWNAGFTYTCGAAMLQII